MSNRMTRRKLVQNGAEPISNDSKRKADARKCLSALILHSEAEGSRTLNLRIDSPMLYPIELRPRSTTEHHI